MLTHARYCDDACCLIIDLNVRSTYTPAVIRVGNEPHQLIQNIIDGNHMSGDPKTCCVIYAK